MLVSSCSLPVMCTSWSSCVLKDGVLLADRVTSADVQAATADAAILTAASGINKAFVHGGTNLCIASALTACNSFLHAAVSGAELGNALAYVLAVRRDGMRGRAQLWSGSGGYPIWVCA
jgi:hypothetical protein